MSEKAVNTKVFPGTSRALATDLYQLTMAQGYFSTGLSERQAIFHMFYRNPPFGGRYVVAAGLQSFADWLDQHTYNEEDLEYLSSLNGRDGSPLFTKDFLSYLGRWKFRGSIEAVPEGTIIFPHEPMVRVRGPLLDSQIIETTLLNLMNFQTLIATKASRVKLAAGEDEVLEFGLRRAHGYDGGLSASRAAYIGGVDATSNVLAGARFGDQLGFSGQLADDLDAGRRCPYRQARQVFRRVPAATPHHDIPGPVAVEMPTREEPAGECSHRIGDDAAVIDFGNRGTIVTVDTQVEGVHFRRDLISCRALGYRAMVAAASDVYAMAGTPSAHARERPAAAPTSSAPTGPGPAV